MDGCQVCLAGGTAIDSGSCQVLTIAHAHGGVVLGWRWWMAWDDERRWWSGRESVSNRETRAEISHTPLPRSLFNTFSTHSPHTLPPLHRPCPPSFRFEVWDLSNVPLKAKRFASLSSSGGGLTFMVIVSHTRNTCNHPKLKQGHHDLST